LIMMASCKSHTNETLFPAVLLRISYFHVVSTKRRTQIFAGRRITDGTAAGSGISLGCPASFTSMVSIARTQAYPPRHAPMVFAVAQPARSTRGADRRIRQPADRPSVFWVRRSHPVAGPRFRSTLRARGRKVPIAERQRTAFRVSINASI
jgi:hypothetical protein